MYLIKSKIIRQIFGVLETANILFIKLLIRNRSASRLYPGRVFREYMSLVGKDLWESREIFQILKIPAGTRIVIEHMEGEGINTALDELGYLALIACASRPERIFEIGTFRGRTALNFAMNSPDNCVVYTLD